MPSEGLRALRERVHGDHELALQLRRVEPERFSAEVLQVASELGCEVSDADLADAIAQARRAWTLRWIR